MKDPRVYIGHMLLAIEKIERYAARDRADPAIVDAIERNLMILGEAAAQVPKEIQERYSQVPWPDVIGLRHRIVHDYFGLDYIIVWDVVDNDMKELKPYLLKIQKALE
jgi:uncharacterized protein with HEPN domain